MSTIAHGRASVPAFARSAEARREGRLHRHRVLAAAQSVVGLELIVLAMTSDLSFAGRLGGAALGLLVSAALVASSASERAVPRGVSALVGGILGVSTGGSIAGSWLVTDGPSPIALVAAAALVAGSLLLLSGTWLLVRATPRWWRLMAIPIGFLVIQLGLMPLMAAVYGTHPPRTPLSAPKPESAQRVSLQTTDGATLVAWYTTARNGAAVILLPGSNGEKGSTIEHAGVLAEHGYGVLALDARGSGDSGGIGDVWGWHGVADVASAVTWLAGRPEVEPGRIAALGLSMGGEVAITAAAAPGSMLSVVVAEGVSARVPEDLAYLPGDPAGVTQLLMGQLMWAVAGFMTDAAPPLPLRDALARATDVPVLLIVGNDPAEAAAAPLLREAAPSAQVWQLTDTPHIRSLALHPAEWETRVIGFLDASLGR